MSHFKALLVLCACLALGETTLKAQYPISLSVTGKFGSASCPTTPCDTLGLAGTTYSMTGTFQSNQTVIPVLNLTTKVASLGIDNVPVSVVAGNPGTVSLSASAVIADITIVFSAIAKLPNIAESQPYPFGARTIGSGSTATYGTTGDTNPTTLGLGGTVVVSTTEPMSASPTTFNFTALPGGSSQSQPLTVSAAGGATATFSLAVGSSAASWLSVSASSGTTPATPNVTVNPGSLAAGNYTGTITLSSGAAPVSTPSITVNLTISAPPPIITPSPGSLTFGYQLLQSPPGTQSITLNSSGTNVSYSVAAGAPSWLSITNGSGTTPGPITVGINTAGLTAQAYNYTITVNLTGASTASVTVPVTLNVTAAPTLSAPTTTLNFSFQIGGATPGSQSVNVTASGGVAIPFTAAASVVTPSGGTWLSAGAGGTTPGSLSISVTPGSLGTGSYTGSVTISSTHASNNVVVPVTLTITSQPVLVANPTSFTFVYQVGGTAPAAQNLGISLSGGSAVSYTLQTTGGSWLSVTTPSGTTPGNTNVPVNVTGLSAGVYTGSVTITASGVANSPLTVPVTLTVSSEPLLSAVPSGLTFSYQAGGAAPSAQSLAVNASSSAALSFTLATSASWLSAAPSSGTTNATSVSVSVNPAGLSAGAYNGSITITSAGASNSGLKVPVTLTVTAAPALSVTPNIVHFIYQIGGVAPASQSVMVGGGAGINYSVSVTTNSGGSWLAAGPNGATPGTLTVQAKPGALSMGTYTGTITLTSTGASNSPLTVSADLTVSAGPLVSAGPGSLSFQVSQGAKAPASQVISLGSSAGALNFTVASSAAWLNVTPTNGATPASLTVSIDPTNLTPATYKGTVTVTANGASNSPVNVAVTLVVSTAGPSLDAVTDAASYATGTISPGSIITLWGTLLGPAAPAVFQVGPSGTVANILANTQVFFDDTPATLLMVSNEQINAIVPYEVAGQTTSTVRVEYLNVQSSSLQVNVSPAAPALFTANASGTGPGAILNHDLTVNSAKNPASKGSVVVLYGEGCGQTNPPGTDGSVTGNVLANLVLPYTVQIGGVDATVKFAGAAPGLVAGVVQINVEVPQQTSSGEVPVVVTVGGVSSQPGVTVNIR